MSSARHCRPVLTLEGYLEPFASSGRYDAFGELAAAGSYDLRVYGSAPGTTGDHFLALKISYWLALR